MNDFTQKEKPVFVGICPLGGHIHRRGDTYLQTTPYKSGENALDSLPSDLAKQNFQIVTEIKFQDGSPAVNGLNGFSNEGVVLALIDRIARLNNELPSGHNLSAIDSLKATLDALNNRNRDRGLVPTPDCVVKDV